ncbi:translation initiation factor IF-2-like [Cervus elaphus]|uniref:translation initiation factor IF-2-like n=1 Tax=Cervus elaphus TaxID=9860 RepID=UPI001CC2A3FC|nr:translation initiation factor IF-2-like [Cervus elaphus]
MGQYPGTCGAKIYIYSVLQRLVCSGKAVSVAGSLISHYLLLTTPPRPHPGRPRGSPRGGTESPASSFRSAKPARAPRGVPEGARAHGRSFARGWRVALPEPGAPGHTPGPEPGSTGSARGGALGGGTCRTRARGGAGAARPPGLCRAATSRVAQEGRTTARLDSTWSGHHCLTRRRSQQLTPHPSDLIPTSTGFPGSPGHKTSPGLLRVPHPMDPRAGFSGLFLQGNLHISPKNFQEAGQPVFRLREKGNPRLLLEIW